MDKQAIYEKWGALQERHDKENEELVNGLRKFAVSGAPVKMGDLWIYGRYIWCVKAIEHQIFDDILIYLESLDHRQELEVFADFLKKDGLLLTHNEPSEAENA